VSILMFFLFAGIDFDRSSRACFDYDAAGGALARVSPRLI